MATNMTQVLNGPGSAGAVGTEERLTTHELNLLLNMMATDKLTTDFMEHAVAGLDLTDRRAQTSVLTLKLRVMLRQAIERDNAELKRQAELGAAAAAAREAAAKEAQDLSAPPPAEPPAAEPLPVPQDPSLLTPVSSPEIGG